MRFSCLWIPLASSKELRNGRSVASHPWIDRAARYTLRACEGKCDVQDVAQELALIRSERSFLVSAERELARPERCAWCAKQRQRCAACADTFKTWRRSARYSAERVRWRVFKLAIRRAQRAARSSEALSALILDSQRELRASAALEAQRAERELAQGAPLARQLAAQERLHAQLEALSAQERAAFRVYLNDVAHRALSSAHKRPLHSVQIAAQRYLRSKLAAPALS